MTSIKLTKEVKSYIANDIIKHKFEPLFDTLVNEECAFANLVYEEHYKNNLKQMQALPTGWLRTSDTAKIMTRGYGVQTFAFSKSRTVKRPYLATDDCGYRGFRVTVSDQINPKFEEPLNNLVKKREQLEKERKDTRRFVESALNKFNTSKQILDAWPEVESFVKPYINSGQASHNLPAVVLDQLNKDLGLPPETKVA